MKYLEDVSPDGRFFLYFRDTDPLPGSLWLMPLSGDRTPALFLQSAAGGKFSPDGHWVAYSRMEEDPRRSVNPKPSLWVAAFPSGQPKWQVSGEGSGPRWSRDGKELFFVSDGKLMAVQIRGRNPLQCDSPKVLFRNASLEGHWEGRNYYDVSADGQTIYLLEKNPTPPASEIHVVVNWTSELERR